MRYFLLDSVLVGAKDTDLMVTLVQFSMGVPHLTDSVFFADLGNRPPL